MTTATTDQPPERPARPAAGPGAPLPSPGQAPDPGTSRGGLLSWMLLGWVLLLLVDLAGLFLGRGPSPQRNVWVLLSSLALTAGLDALPALLLPLLLLLPARTLIAGLRAEGGFAGLLPAACLDTAVEPERLRRSSAWRIAASPALVALGLAWLHLAHWLLANVHDHRLGAAVWVCAAFTLAAIAWILARLGAQLLAPRLTATLLRPAPQLVLVLLPPLGGALLLLGSSWVGWARLPWTAAGALLGPPALLLAAGALLPRTGSFPRVVRLLDGRLRWPLRSGLTAAVLLVLLLAGSWSEAIRLVHEKSWWAAPVLTVLRRATDVDRDGFSGLLGGGDCASLDPARHPGAREIAGNGVDEDCNGADRSPTQRSAGPAPPTWIDHPLVRPGGWSFVLIVMDATRADHVSLLGYPRPTTPRLAELGARSWVFPWAYSPSATTRFSMPALLAGRSPSALAWRRKGRNLFLAKKGNLLLQERLQRAGIFTAAVTCSYDIFAPSFGLAAGFDHYDTSSIRYASERSIEGRTSAQVTDAALRLLEEIGERRFFLYLHYMDPHAPYDDPGGATFGTTDIDRYDAEIRFTDEQVGRLLDRLLQRPDADRLLVAVAADHGDQFGERGRTGHGRYVYDEEVHVPLVLRIPGAAPQRIEEPVSLIDLAPTVANLMGVRHGWERFEGRNLLPLLHGESLAGPVVVETWPFSAFDERRVALVQLPYKLIFDFRSRSWEAYDLLRDPGEKHDLYPELDEDLRAPRQRSLEAWLEEHRLR